MSDELFTIKGVSHDSSAYAQKNSVLWPILSRRSLHNDAVIKDITALRLRWHARLGQLKAGGWADLAPAGVQQFARNCPPSDCVYSVASKPLRPCKLRAICPFCYMRMVGRVYNVAAKQLPERGELTTPLKFVSISSQLKIPKNDAGKYLSGTLLEWSVVPKKLLMRLKPLGAFKMVTLEPRSVHGQISSYAFTYRILALVPETWEMPEWLKKGKRKVQVTNVKSRKQLVGVVAKTCRYPVGLFNGDLRMTIISLNARRGKRLNEFTGCFRAANGGTDV